MFADDMEYKTQDVRGWNLKADILVHGSPCQSYSISGHLEGGDEGSGTQSSLMWETIKIIRNLGVWKPRIVIWENVKNVLSKRMVHNFNRYLEEMTKLGYSNSFEVLDARDFGLPQKRQRVFVVSILGSESFDFDNVQTSPMRNLKEFLEENVEDRYLVTQPSILGCIGEKGIRRATVITDCANTVTCRQDRTPAQIIEVDKGQYRFLTERECWRLMGFSDEDFDLAKEANESKGRMNRDLYKQAGNSMPVPVLEAIFTALKLGRETKRKHE